MKWISFDCYGTLVDWNGGFVDLLTSAGVERAYELVTFYHVYEPLVQSESFRTYRDVLSATIERAACAAGRSLSAAQRSALADRWGDLPVFTDTAPALEQLRSDGWSLAVLTNCDDDLFALTQAAIGVDFDAVITAEQVRSYKPHLDHFKRFAERFVHEGDVWVHAANSWVYDIEPARRFGVPRIWIAREKSGHDPTAATAVLDDMRPLPQTVRNLTLSPKQ